MAGATLTTLDAILKETYGPKIIDQLQSDVVFLQYMKKKTRPFVGRTFHVPVHTGRNEGMGFRSEGGTLPGAGSQAYTEAKVTPAYFYGKYQISGPSIEQTRNDEGAFARSQTLEVQGMVTDISKRLNQAFYLNQAGARGTVDSWNGGTGVATLTGASKGLAVGMRVDFISSNLGTKRNTGYCTITAVTNTTGLNDTSVIDITVTGTTGTPQNGDIVVMDGSVNTSGSVGIGISGLADVMSTSSTYLTIAPGTYAQWKANVLTNSGTLRSVSEDLIQQAMDVTRQKSGKSPTLLLTTYNIRRRFFNSLAPNRRFVNTKKLVAGGAEIVDFDGRDMVVDPDCTNYSMFGLVPDDWGVAQTRDGHWIDDDGTVLHRDLSDTDSYYATWRWFFQLHALQRNANFKLGDLTE